MNGELTEKNFLVYAMKAYNNPHVLDHEEFQEDLKRIKYIKRLFKKYLETGQLRARLVINHMIESCRMYSVQKQLKMLFFQGRN